MGDMNDNNNKYKYQNIVLGEGGFSIVLLAINIENNKYIAIKKISLDQEDKILDYLRSEIEIMPQFKHNNIVAFHDFYEYKSYWYIVMEYCNAGTLANVIEYNESMSKTKSVMFNREENTYYYLNQLKDALIYIQNLGYVHRDIKPLNILLTRDANDNEYNYSEEVIQNYYFTEKYIVKLADFGMSKSCTDKLVMNTLCGSPLYMAPEIICERKYNSQSDLWSFGVIMYQMLFGIYPIKISDNVKEIFKNVQTQEINFHTHKNFSPQCFDLLKKLLVKNAKDRIDWPIFFDHNWFSSWKNNYHTDILCNKGSDTNGKPSSFSGFMNFCINDYPTLNSKKYRNPIGLPCPQSGRLEKNRVVDSIFSLPPPSLQLQSSQLQSSSPSLQLQSLSSSLSPSLRSQSQSQSQSQSLSPLTKFITQGTQHAQYAQHDQFQLEKTNQPNQYHHQYQNLHKNLESYLDQKQKSNFLQQSIDNFPKYVNKYQTHNNDSQMYKSSYLSTCHGESSKATPIKINNSQRNRIFIDSTENISNYAPDYLSVSPLGVSNLSKMKKDNFSFSPIHHIPGSYSDYQYNTNDKSQTTVNKAIRKKLDLPDITTTYSNKSPDMSSNNLSNCTDNTDNTDNVFLKIHDINLTSELLEENNEVINLDLE